MRLAMAALVFLTSCDFYRPAIAQIPDQTLALVPTARPALQCPAGVACNPNPTWVNDDVYDGKPSTSIIWQEIRVPKVITETATTVEATVRVHEKNPEAQCVKFNHIPREKPPIVYFYMNTTTTIYSLTTTTTTSTTTIDADVTAPAGCVLEVDRPKQPELPSNEEDVCKPKSGQPNEGEIPMPQPPKPGDARPKEPSPGPTSDGGNDYPSYGDDYTGGEEDNLPSYGAGHTSGEKHDVPLYGAGHTRNGKHDVPLYDADHASDGKDDSPSYGAGHTSDGMDDSPSYGGSPNGVREHEL